MCRRGIKIAVAEVTCAARRARATSSVAREQSLSRFRCFSYFVIFGACKIGERRVASDENRRISRATSTSSVRKTLQRGERKKAFVYFRFSCGRAYGRKVQPWKARTVFRFLRRPRIHPRAEQCAFPHARAPIHFCDATPPLCGRFCAHIASRRAYNERFDKPINRRTVLLKATRDFSDRDQRDEFRSDK